MGSNNQHHQDPVAVVGSVCHLPGGNTNPHKLWEIFRRGGIASTRCPATASTLPQAAHHAALGGMCLEDIDLANFYAHLL
jgi:acyl transferase domain-containing protein